MDLSTQDEEILIEILKQGQRIYSLYFENNPQEHILDIEDAIEFEDELIKELKINVFKLSEIEHLILKKIESLPRPEYLLGTSPNLTQETYSYYRLLGRLHHRLNQIGDYRQQFDRIFIDQEVSILFKLLYPLSKEDQILLKYVHSILIDSPKTEKELLRNGLKPSNNITTIRSNRRFQFLITGSILRIMCALYQKTHNLDTLNSSPTIKLYLNNLKTILLYIETDKRENLINELLQTELFYPFFEQEIELFKMNLKQFLEGLSTFENENIRLLTLVSKSK